MLRFRRYVRHLAPLLRPLRRQISRYEREAGLESSEQLLAEVLDGASPAPSTAGQQGQQDWQKGDGQQPAGERQGERHQPAEQAGRAGRDEL